MGLYYLFWGAAKCKYVKPWCFTNTLVSARKGKEDLSVFHLAVPYLRTVAISAQRVPSRIQFLSLCCFFCGDPKTCCHKKGTASLAQFVIQKEGSFSNSPMLQLIWWKERCFLLSSPSNTSAPSPKPHIWKWHRHCPSVWASLKQYKKFGLGNTSLL